MGQLCSCTRSQDRRVIAGKLSNKTLLPPTPSAKSNCYISNNVNLKHLSTYDYNDFTGALECRSSSCPRCPAASSVLQSRQPPRATDRRRRSSVEDSGICSNGSSADGRSTTNCLNEEPTRPPSKAPPPPRPPPPLPRPPPPVLWSRESVIDGNADDSRSLKKTSSVNDVAMTSCDAVVSDKLYLKTSVSVETEDVSIMQTGSDLVAVKVSSDKHEDHLETQAQKIRAVVQKTVEILASEVDSSSIAEYLERSRPGRELTIADWNHCCSQTEAQDLFWNIITGQDQNDYDVFCDVIESKPHFQHLVDLLKTLDSLIAIVCPCADDDDDDEVETPFSEEEEDLRLRTKCDKCKGLESSDFDLDLVFCHREISIANLLPVLPPAKDERTAVQLQNLDCSSLSLAAGGSYLPSITGDELGQVNVPMLSLSLVNYCLCCRERISLLRQVLQESNCIRELALIKSHVRDDDLRDLLRALPSNTSLTRLDLRLNSFGVESAEHLADALRRNFSLRFLNVASTGLSDIGCSRLMTGIARNRCLSDLDVGFNDIRDTGCHAVAETLVSSSHLRKLRMRDNGITCYGACALFQSLARNCRLCFLDISSNGIGNDSMRYLSEALISNRTLRELNLENCRISVDGCKALARALRANTALRHLQMSLNPITDAGLESLADGLRYNHTVETLAVNMCNVGNLGFLRLLDSLRFNYTLQTIKLCYNNIGSAPLPQPSREEDAGLAHLSPLATSSLDEIFEKLFEVLHCNPKLKILLWGNDLERMRRSSSANRGGCHGHRFPSFSKSSSSSSSSYNHVLNVYRQDVLVEI